MLSLTYLKKKEKKTKYKNAFNNIHNSTTEKHKLRNEVRKVCRSPAHNGTWVYSVISKLKYFSW